jgi:hypothetical protein
VAPDAHNISPLAGGVPIRDLFAPVVEDRDDDALAAWGGVPTSISQSRP